MVHVSVAVAVTVLGVAVGVRAWGLYQTIRACGGLGTSLLALLGVQVGSASAALVVAGKRAPTYPPTALESRSRQHIKWLGPPCCLGRDMLCYERSPAGKAVSTRTILRQSQ